MTTKAVTINAEQRLFVIPCDGGYSCLGFDVCETRTVALARELASLGVSIPQPAILGTLERYQQYRALCTIAAEKNRETGWRSKSELQPKLIGLEGKWVECRFEGGEVRRFYVGKSTGFIPCHLEIKTKMSSGGMAVCGEVETVKVLD